MSKMSNKFRQDRKIGFQNTFYTYASMLHDKIDNFIRKRPIGP